MRKRGNKKTEYTYRYFDIFDCKYDLHFKKNDDGIY